MTTLSKQNVIKELQTHESDTGSTQVQIGILTARIAHLTEHLKIHKHDHHPRRGLLSLVGRRGSLLRYLRTRNADKYREVVEHLKLRG